MMSTLISGWLFRKSEKKPSVLQYSYTPTPTFRLPA